MVLCNVKCVERIAQYLDALPKKLESFDKNSLPASENEDNSPHVQNFCTIIQTFTRRSKYSNLLGSEREEQALSHQWLEYVATHVNYADLAHERIFNELNTVLRDVTYITGIKKSIADIALYYTLYFIMKDLSLQEKAQYIHVSRWFDNIQQEKKLRQELSLISFNLLHLYL